MNTVNEQQYIRGPWEFIKAWLPVYALVLMMGCAGLLIGTRMSLENWIWFGAGSVFGVFIAFAGWLWMERDRS